MIREFPQRERRSQFIDHLSLKLEVRQAIDQIHRNLQDIGESVEVTRIARERNGQSPRCLRVLTVSFGEKQQRCEVREDTSANRCALGWQPFERFHEECVRDVVAP